MKRIALAVFLALSFVATAALAQDKNADALRKMEAEFVKAVAENGHDAYFSYFAEDGVEIDNGTVATKDEMRKQGPWAPGTSLTWSPTKAELAASGDMGYTWGNFEFKTKDKEGKEETERGIYMTVWKKQKDGSWKVVADVGSPAPAAKP
jgi:ketosteroid isomerase-like protein